jgi:hypothetical protein
VRKEEGGTDAGTKKKPRWENATNHVNARHTIWRGQAEESVAEKSEAEIP